MTYQKKDQTRSTLDTHPQNCFFIQKNSLLLLCKLVLLLICFTAFGKYQLLPSVAFIARCDISLANSISFHATIELK